jgi:hypothetical protein
MEEIILPHAKNATIPIQDLINHFRNNNLNGLTKILMVSLK